MNRTTSSVRIGPEFTPPLIKKLIFITVGIGILSALFEGFFLRFMGMQGPQTWFSLSWYGLSNYYLWQPFTYLFLSSSGFQGVSLNLLITLAFQMYVLWIMGSTLLQRVGSRSFLTLYFTAGVLAGILTLLLTGNSYTLLAGPSASLIALLVVWTLLNPEMEILLFFVFPVKIKWLTTGILGGILLISVSQLNASDLIFYFTGASVGYMYGVGFQKLFSPFPFTARFDRFLQKLTLPSIKKEQTANSSKIVNFKTGKPDLSDDDRFVDAMLTKISKYGEKSLTRRERQRMEKISHKKRKENQPK